MLSADEVKHVGKRLNAIKHEVRKGLVGQEYVVDSVLKSLMCNGHVLLEGVPGLAKTFLVRLLTKTVKGASFQRIQFTPDLLPSDVTGVIIYVEQTGKFEVQKGPLFANFVLGDEINRTTPKVQSAMLQAMQEREVTIGKETFALPKPFFVLATQNPLEQQGTYPLAVAQVDRFLFKVDVDYPTEDEEYHIIEQNADVKTIDDFGIQSIFEIDEFSEIQKIVKEVHSSEEIKDYILDLVDATRHSDKYGVETGKYVKYGASPRALIFLNLAAKANALMNGRTYVIPEDVKEIAQNVLRHRIILNYEGKAKGIKTDEIVQEILTEIPVV